MCAAFWLHRCVTYEEAYAEFWRSGHFPAPITKCMVVNTASIGPGSHWFLLFVETLFDPSDEAGNHEPASPTQTTQRGAARLHRSPNNDHLEQVPVQPSKAMRALFR